MARRPHRGQAIVEFAIVAPLLLLIIIGGLGLGIVVIHRMQLSSVAYEAAVAGAQQGGCASSLGRVPQLLGREPSSKDCELELGGKVVVVHLVDNQNVPFPGVPSTIDVTARAVVREEPPMTSPTSSP